MRAFREIQVKCELLAEEAIAEACLITLEEAGLCPTVKALTVCARGNVQKNLSSFLGHRRPEE